MLAYLNVLKESEAKPPSHLVDGGVR